jgi:hypothetical protein
MQPRVPHDLLALIMVGENSSYVAHYVTIYSLPLPSATELAAHQFVLVPHREVRLVNPFGTSDNAYLHVSIFALRLKVQNNL